MELEIREESDIIIVSIEYGSREGELTRITCIAREEVSDRESEHRLESEKVEK
jgi:hypothetical protein